ncbi:MAG TPA: AP2 domain-containing protein [Flavobacteriales bacterium]|nr:AP2 domain-containing protein [Flavobacteriales bacterium]
MSLLKRKPIYGVGINDAEYMVRIVVDGNVVLCPFYRKWHSMITRCLSVNYQSKHPTYKGVGICNDWLVFSVFKQWMIKQDWQGRDLDKDILTQGNKIYSPEFCIFVPNEVNKLFTNRKLAGGDYPQGVHFSVAERKYKAQCCINGRQDYLGFFSTPELASEAYKKAKYKEIKRVALEQNDTRLRDALLAYIITE